MTFIDLFCGIGGFRLGMQANGFQCNFSAEINPHACTMYQANFGENPLCDISKMDENAIHAMNDFDIMCGGFPCQAFSKAGKQKGFDDTRGTLFFELCRIIAIKRPKILFLENVKNLVSHDKGNTFKTILATLEDLNYHVTYKVLNACDFGSPQNRERTIIVGINKDFSHMPFDFSWVIKNENKPSIDSILEERDDLPCLSANEYTIIDNPKVQPLSGLKFVGYRNKNLRLKGILPGTEHLSRCHKQNNRIYDSQGTHPTLSSQETSGRYFIYKDNKVRKLTLLECYRLMGFPDNFIKVGAVSHLYNRVGNSICVPMVSAISYALKEHYLK